MVPLFLCQLVFFYMRGKNDFLFEYFRKDWVQNLRVKKFKVLKFSDGFFLFC